MSKMKRWISLILSMLILCTSLPAYAGNVSETENIPETTDVFFQIDGEGMILVDGEDVTWQTKSYPIGTELSYTAYADDGYVLNSMLTAYDDGTEDRITLSGIEYTGILIVNQPTTLCVLFDEEDAEYPEYNEEDLVIMEHDGAVNLTGISTYDVSTGSMVVVGGVVPSGLFNDVNYNQTIKYVQTDGSGDMVDSSGTAKNRVVYCLEYKKSYPGGTITSAGGELNSKIIYCLLYGVHYKGETCAYPSYSTGDWQKDYVVTQSAIHVLNGEYSVDTICGKINDATTREKIKKLVNDANNAGYYNGFSGSDYKGFQYFLSPSTQSGWSSYTYNGQAGYITNSWYNQDFRDTIYMTKSVPWYIKYVSATASGVNGAQIVWQNGKSWSAFKIWVPKSSYESAQATGATVTVTLTNQIPSYFSGWRYNPPHVSQQATTCFEGWGYTNKVSYATATIAKVVTNGTLKVTKTSSDTSLVSGNGNYSLENAVFTAYQAGTSNVAATLRTDASGVATGTLRTGNYDIVETTAPKGYNINSNKYTVYVPSGGTGRVTVSDTPKTGKITVQKKAEKDLYPGYETYSVKGAEYGVYNASGTKMGTITIGDNGKGSLSGLALGSYTVKELKAPAGYYLSTETLTADITESSLSVTVNSTEKADDITITGKLLLEKVDADAKEAQGAATLTGAEYTFKYYDVISDYDPAKDTKSPKYTWVLKTDEKGQIKMDQEHLVSGNILKDEDGNIVFPVGTITIQETKAPEGYNLDKTVFVANALLTDGQMKVNNLPTGKNASKERIFRADIQFSKTNENNKAMADIPFKITSRTTGESHVIYSDRNGMIRTAVRDNANPNVDKNGVWFGEGTPSDDRGALIYDTYVVEEQPCTENQGYILESFEVSITEDGVVVKADTLKNLPQPKKVVVTKKIKESDINFHNGNPIFTFKLTGTDYDGLKHTYYRMTEFDKSSIHTENGYLSVTCTFDNIPMGDYVLTEEQASRYKMEKVEAVNGSVTEESVSFDMVPSEDTYEATFTNRKFEWQYLTDNTMVTNTITVK